MAIQVRRNGAWVDNTGEKKRVNGAWVNNSPYKVMKPTISGVPPFTFKSDGENLRDWSMSGQTVQASTPTPSTPVAVGGVGTLSGSDYIIPVTCGGTTTNLFLGSATSTRRVKKLVLTGSASENWSYVPSGGISRFRINLADAAAVTELKSTHYVYELANAYGNAFVNTTLTTLTICHSLTTVDAFKAFLAEQYAAGTPVTIWYVLATPETAATNEPLMKIGSYADEISKTGTGVNIPTVSGSNTLTVGTTVQPSEMTIESISQWV